MTELRLILDKSRKSIEEISLGLISSGEVDICTQLILYGKYKVGDKIIEPESEFSGYKLDSLRSLKFNTVSSVFDRLMDYHFVFKQSIFGQLEELRIRIENAPTVLKYFGFSEFPRLRVLECYTGQDIVGSSTNEVAFLDSLDEAGGDRDRYNQQPQLKVLRLGLPFKISKVNEFPYYRSRASVAISPQSLQRLLRLVPELEEFSCRMVNTRRVTDRMMNVRGAGLRLNLREMTPKLKTLDLSYSELRAMPLVPATCEVIRLDYCEKMGLRACETFRGVRYYTDVLDSEGDGYFLANMPDEYLNLCKVSLVHSAVETEKLFDGLVRCDTERLTHLNLHGCDQIDFSQSLPAKSDFCKNYKRYGFFDDPSRSPLAQLVVHIFPNLEELYVGGISSVDDATLDAFTMLENLRLLEITDTNTTLRGITHVLLKENTPTTTGDLQKSLALRQFDKFRTRLASMPIELFPLSRVIISEAVVADWFIDAFVEVGVVIEVASNLFEGYHSSK
ncbi:hypothetical protein BZA70DRAFT_291500 [Myxozyma melibiosi]|uniref:Uncharacterized protein n=1 Tax=Myxozyma melibiosi TaxID=54550 RepID=A0ABR1EZM8_9ASCO